MHDRGQGIPENPHMAFEYYKKAATTDPCKEAFYDVGLMYENGRGVEQSFSQAKRWYGKAAKLGMPPADQALKRVKQQERVQKKTEEAREGENKPTPAKRAYIFMGIISAVVIAVTMSSAGSVVYRWQQTRLERGVQGWEEKEGKDASSNKSRRQQQRQRNSGGRGRVTQRRPKSR